MTILFDPTKSFGNVSGQSSQYPGARYTQGLFIFDAHRRCMNPDEEEKVELDSDQHAAELRLKKNTAAKAEAALKEVLRFQSEHAAKGTSASRGCLTKAENKYKKIQKQLEEFKE